MNKYFKRIAGASDGEYIFIFGNPRFCRMKILNVLLYLILVLFQNSSITP